MLTKGLLQLPYLNWEEYRNLPYHTQDDLGSDTEDDTQDGPEDDTQDDPEDDTQNDPEDDTQNNHGLQASHHPRRTLDQYFYSGLRNTAYRDAGQTVSKWTGKDPAPGENGRDRAAEDSYVIMVDQLWVWYLGDSE